MHMCIIAPFSSPNDVRLVDVQPGQMTFNWTSVDTECKSLAYKIISSNCGRCPATTHNTTVTCIDVVASGQVCTFIVQTEVCGNLTGNFSNAVSVTLKGTSSYHYHHYTNLTICPSVCESGRSREVIRPELKRFPSLHSWSWTLHEAAH